MSAPSPPTASLSARALALAQGTALGALLGGALPLFDAWRGGGGDPAVRRALWLAAGELPAAVGVGAVIGLGAGLILALLTRRRPAARWAWLGPALLAAPAALAAAAPDWLLRPLAPRVAARELLSEPVFDLERFALTLDGDVAARVGMLSPSRDVQQQKSDLPALFLPPPATAELVVQKEEAGAELIAFAGVDYSIADVLASDAVPRVLFEVRKNGERVFRHRVAVKRDAEGAFEGEWRAVQGLGELAAGDRIELRTTAEGPPEGVALPVGFGGLTFQRQREFAAARATRRRPAIVLIVMDTQRQDRVSAYGYGAQLTPNVDNLARRGVLYEQGYSPCSWTWPATASLFTGLEPNGHGVINSITSYLSGGFDTLAEGLQRAGYRTAAWSANPLIVPAKNFAQGFAEFAFDPQEFRTSNTLLPDVLRWIDEHAGERFFLYLHLADPHIPHRPLPKGRDEFTSGKPLDFPPHGMTRYGQRLRKLPGPEATWLERARDIVPSEHLRWMREAYDACVWTGDFQLGRVLSKLHEHGLSDTTLVAYTSDHGEELMDRGQLKHGHTLYGELVRVPLVLAGPGVPAGVRCTTPVSNLHLAATLARVGGATLHQVERTFDLRDPPALPDEPVFFCTEYGLWEGATAQAVHGVRRGKWLLQLRVEDLVNGEREGLPPLADMRLFDVERDPAEETNVADAHPDEARALAELVLANLARLERMRPHLATGAGASTLDLLRGIGYLGEDEE